MKAGLPSGDEAVAMLETGLAVARGQRARVVRVIHGWGSSGTGGTIRERIRQHLNGLRGRGSIRSWVPGDDFSISSEASDRLLRSVPELRRQLVQDRHNPGISFVEL